MMSLNLGNDSDDGQPDRIEERKSELDEDDASPNHDLENQWSDMIQNDDRIQAFEPILEGNEPDRHSNIDQQRDNEIIDNLFEENVNN
jgi:hypothetical protein